jgi:hypothetical protein
LTANHPPAQGMQESKQLFLKIAYLEKENDYFNIKISELQHSQKLDKEIINELIQNQNSLLNSTKASQTVSVEYYGQSYSNIF